VAHKEAGPKVDYLCGYIYESVNFIVQKIKELIGSGGISPNDIFVLVPSVKSQNPKTPMKVLENRLVNLEFPCYVSTKDDSGAIDETVIRGKIVFCTFHQAKGLERACVFVFNFNRQYFKFYEKNLSMLTCPCTLYVAATRATNYLCIVGCVDLTPMVYSCVCVYVCVCVCACVLACLILHSGLFSLFC
jgi:hypothetical protein